MTNEELAYIAGFFDGEGSITIHENCRPSPRGKAPNHTMQVSIGNTDPAILIWLHLRFGGSLITRPSFKPNHRAVTQWIVRARMALPFLKAIQPFIRMKGAQVALAIEFQERKLMRGPERVTASVIEWREAMRTRMRILNGRNVA